MPTEPHNYAERPNTIPWPPILLGFCLLGPLLLAKVIPLDTGQRFVELGLGMLAAAFVIDGWVFETFRKYRTEIMPHKPATKLVTDGPFKYSRNPVYFGNVMIIMAGAAFTGSAWFLISAIIFVFAVTRLAIIREEQHLAALFGQEWEEYRARVRRWFG